MASAWVVHKFGGTSVAGAARYRAVADIVRAVHAQGQHVAVVVSAMAKVTDALLRCVDLSAQRDERALLELHALEQRHVDTASELLSAPDAARLAARFHDDVRDIADILRAVYLMRSRSEAIAELVSGYGELWSAQLLGAHMNTPWLDARRVLVVAHGELGPVVDWPTSGERSYVPRLAEKSVLHEVVRENLETFLAQARSRTEHGFGVPRFVEEELRAFIRCGIINHGFARVRCGTCCHELFVAFSCKRRGARPSCSGRRAAECAAHLVDEVFPPTPTRMWTLTFPRRLRFALAKDARLATTILGIWHRALASFYRLSAKKDGFRATRTGAVTFVHRFSSSLALKCHPKSASIPRRDPILLMATPFVTATLHGPCHRAIPCGCARTGNAAPK